MLKKVSIVMPFVLLLAGCTTCRGVATKSAEGEGEPPVILDSYAAEYIRPGATWRVYLKTEDADGDMHYIAAQLWQAGVGYYPTSFTFIKGGDREGFAGYLILTTPADRRLLPDNFKLEVLLRDCEGNKSESLYIPLNFALKTKFRTQPVPEKWQAAAQRQLGIIHLDIISSEAYNSNDGSRPFF
jgi:hypothetical protein